MWRTKATMSRISSSLWFTPKAGIPVMRMPFLTTQNSSASESCCRAGASMSGGLGFIPSWNSAGSMPGAPWQGKQFSR